MPINPYDRRAKTKRITTPRGTPLSNPSTAADGFLGGPLGNNPSGAQINPAPAFNYSQRFALTPGSPGANMIGAFKDWWNGLPGNNPYQNPQNYKTNVGQPQLFRSPGGVPIQGYTDTQTFNGVTTSYTNPIAYDSSGARYKYDSSTQQYVRDNTSAFSSPSTNGLDVGPAPKPFNGNLVGLTLGPDTKQLELKTAMQLVGPQYSKAETDLYMSKLGYQYAPGPRGGTYIYTGEGADPNFKPVGVTGNYQSQGGTTKDQYGNTIIEGTTMNDGTRQYTSISPNIKKGGNFNSVVKKDSQGNWVRYVVPVYENKKYNRQNARRQAAYEAQKQSAQNAAQQQNQPVSNQLVNLRVNYG